MANTKTRTRVALNERSGRGQYTRSSRAVEWINGDVVGGGGMGGGVAVAQYPIFFVYQYCCKGGGGGGSGGVNSFSFAPGDTSYGWYVGGGGSKTSSSDTAGDPGGLGPRSDGGDGNGGGASAFGDYYASGGSGGKGGNAIMPTGQTEEGKGGDGGWPNGVSGGEGQGTGGNWCSGGSGGELGGYGDIGRGGNGGGSEGPNTRHGGSNGSSGRVYVVETIRMHEIILSSTSNGTLSYVSTPVEGYYFDANYNYTIKAKANNRFRIRSITVLRNDGSVKQSQSWPASDNLVETDYVITSISEPLTVYAEFEQKEFDITYHYNDLSETPSSRPGPFTYSNGDGVSTALPSPTRQYCQFAGWFTTDAQAHDPANNQGNRVYSIPDDATGNKTFYAGWYGNTGVFQFQYNREQAGSAITGDGTANASVTYDPYNGIRNITLPSPETTGGIYRFYGWYENGNFTGSRWRAGADYNGGYVNKILYARWYTCNVTLRPDMRGGTGAQDQAVNVRPGTSTTFTIWSNFQEYSGYTGFTSVDDYVGYYIDYDGTWTRVTPFNKSSLGIIAGTTEAYTNDVPIREQYEFQLWAEYPDGTGGQYNPGASITVDAPVAGDEYTVVQGTNHISVTKTLYAIWEELYDIIIRYRPNGGKWSGGGEDEYVYSISSTNPVKTVDVFTASGGNPVHDPIAGDTVNFLGWGENAEDKIPYYSETGLRTYSTSGPGDYPSSRVITLVLYAVWSGVQEITFIAKITSSPPPGYPQIEGDAIIAADDLFKGFNTVTLTTGADGRLRESPVSIANKHIFDNWWSNALSGTKVIDDNGVVSDALPSMIGDRFTEGVVLYAHWVPVFYITFTNIPIIGETMVPTNRMRQVEPPDLSSLENYIITGWYDSDDHLVDFTTKTFNSDETLRARYVSCFTVTFDANGGTYPYPPITRRTNATYQINLPYPTAIREGYTMDTMGGQATGWYYADNPAYPVKEGTMYQRNRTLIAKWLPRDYTVTFDANGGSFDGGAATVQWTEVTFGMPFGYIKNQEAMRSFPLPTSPPSGSRLTFLGYSDKKYTHESDEMALYTADSIFDSEGLRTLYAVWRTGEHEITFNPMGGSVQPPRSITDLDGVIAYYPIPRRTGYNFTGWYLWPIYATSENIGTQQTDIMKAYRDASGLDGTPVKNTLLVSAYGDVVKQYKYSGTEWEDVTGYLYQTYYYSTDMPERQDPLRPDEPYILGDLDQSDVLTTAWQSTRDYAGWEQYDALAPKVTFGEFENLTELVLSGRVPRNNDVAKVGSSLYYRFTMPFGLTYVMVRSDEHNDAAYTWTKDDSIIVDPGTPDEFKIGGKWVNSTDDEMTVVLPFKTFSSDTEVFAHWILVPPPSTLSNVCYIERRLSKYGDDSVRMYLPTVTDIEDVITANLVQKDTLMFGYRNKFLSDLGTSRRLAVTVVRPNPMPYDDENSDPSVWSNGKWYKAFLDFTDYWQNFGRDTVTGSMIGGFRFCYTPMAHSDEDDRVEYSELYPVMEKNVFLTGNTDVSFTDTVLKFTMNLAVGQMTSDANSIGYEVKLVSNDSTGKNEPLIYNTPQGIDFQVPSRPVLWNVPEGKMFSHWKGSDGKVYRTGDFIKYTVAKEYRDESKGTYFTLSANYADNEACAVLTSRDAGGEHHVGGDGLFRITAVDDDNYDDVYEVEFLDNALVDMTLIGGGGGGAGGERTNESIISSDKSLGENVAAFFINIITAQTLVDVLPEARMSSGGAGGSGVMSTFTRTVSTGDKLKCIIGKGGGTEYEDKWNGRLYKNGINGDNTIVQVLFADSTSPMMEYVAEGGVGGQRNGAGGASFMKGGDGCRYGGTPSDGYTSLSAPSGRPGSYGYYCNEPWGDAGMNTYWCGGAGGGAAPLRHKFIAKGTYLEGGNDGETFLSVGGNGATSRYLPSKDASKGQFGGGGGSGCCGCTWLAPGESAGLIINRHNPAPGGDGVIFLQVTKR